MQDFNYHSHTKRCGHATGEDREYIEAAIAGGFKVLGTSDHIPWFGWDEEEERMPFADLDEYLKTWYALKEEYKDQIDLQVGFEFEFFEDKIDYLKEIQNKVDYLVIGQHAKMFGYYYDQHCTQDDVFTYANQIEQALDLGLTKYVAHLDYFLLGKEDFTKEDEKAIHQICEAANRNHAYIEVNLKGMKYGRKTYRGEEQYIYPHYDVFKIVAKHQCKVVCGYDAHYPNTLTQREQERKIKEEFKDLGLNFIEHIRL